MSIQLHFSVDERGFSCVEADPPFEMVGQCFDELSSEIGLSSLVIEAKSVISDENTNFEIETDEFKLMLGKDEATVHSYEADDSVSVPIKDFYEALTAWHDFVMKDICAPVKALVSAIVEKDSELSIKKYTEALDQCRDQSHLLSDQNGYIFANALERLYKIGMIDKADQCADLLIDLAVRNRGGYAGNFLVRIGQDFNNAEQFSIAERLYKGALAWNNTEPKTLIDAKNGVLKQMIDCYALLLKQNNRGEQSLRVYDELQEVGAAFASAYVDLHRAAGLYDEVLSVMGLGQLGNSLQAMLRNAGGLPSLFPAAPEVKITEQELEEKLRSRVFSTDESTKQYNRVMQLTSRLEAALNNAKPEADLTEFFHSLKKLVDIQLFYMKKIEVGENQVFDASPPSVSYANVAADPESVCTIIESNRGKSEPRPGSPNAEPYVIWKQFKDRSLYRLLPEVARKLGTASNGFIVDFHMTPERALPQCADNIEKEFESKPQFIVQCFTELAKIYELENRPADAAIFNSRIKKYESIEPTENDRADLKPQGFAIFVTHNKDDHASKLYNALRMQLATGSIPYTTVECCGTEAHELAPRLQFMRVYVDGPNVDELEQLCLRELEKVSPPVEVILERAGKSKWWKKGE